MLRHLSLTALIGRFYPFLYSSAYRRWIFLLADSPCAIVSRVAQPGQQVVHTTLGALCATKPATAPSLPIAGWAVREPAVQSGLDAGATFATPVRKVFAAAD